MKTKLLFTALAAVMLLTTACSKENKGGEIAGTGGGVGAKCVNCTGFAEGPAVFSGSVSNGGSRIDGLQILADVNSLALAAQTYSTPKIQGTYQALVGAGTFTSVGAACLPNGTYQLEGFQVGTVSPNLGTQASNPLWVVLSGPTTVKATMYVALADSNGDDTADVGTKVYLWIPCNGAWSRVDLAAY